MKVWSSGMKFGLQQVFRTYVVLRKFHTSRCWSPLTSPKKVRISSPLAYFRKPEYSMFSLILLWYPWLFWARLRNELFVLFFSGTVKEGVCFSKNSSHVLLVVVRRIFISRKNLGLCFASWMCSITRMRVNQFFERTSRCFDGDTSAVSSTKIENCDDGPVGECLNSTFLWTEHSYHMKGSASMSPRVNISCRVLRLDFQYR